MIERDEAFLLRTGRTPGTLAKALAAIAEFGATIGEIETVYIGAEHNIREVTVIAPGDVSIEDMQAALDAIDGVEVVQEHVDKVFARHEGGKLKVLPTVEVQTLPDMRRVYTPGVARVSEAIHKDPDLADRYTWKGRTIAVVSDGSRVLGLGDIGPVASLPVMEGKAMFYSMLVGLNAVPIVLDVHEPDEIVRVTKAIAPGFAGIHLEDIATPGVYEVEARLDAELDVPVMHDDQHGTAVVLLAAVLSATHQLGLEMPKLTFGQVGLGAAGSAIAQLATSFPFAGVIAYDPAQVAVDHLVGRADDACELDAGSDDADFDSVVDNADVLVLTTGRAGLLPAERVREGQVIFALTNPVAEIHPREAQAAGAALATDGSIVNNVLAYPGLFKGALESKASSITLAMKRAAATALKDLAGDRLLPDPLDPAVHERVAVAVAAEAD